MTIEELNRQELRAFELAGRALGLIGCAVGNGAVHLTFNTDKSEEEGKVSVNFIWHGMDDGMGIGTQLKVPISDLMGKDREKACFDLSSAVVDRRKEESIVMKKRMELANRNALDVTSIVGLLEFLTRAYLEESVKRLRRFTEKLRRGRRTRQKIDYQTVLGAIDLVESMGNNPHFISMKKKIKKEVEGICISDKTN